MVSPFGLHPPDNKDPTSPNSAHLFTFSPILRFSNISQLTHLTMPATQPELGTDPLPIIWKGEEEYEEARVGRVFNLRRPKRYPVGVLEARNVSDGTSRLYQHGC